MKKVINVSLGGRSFTLDEDAYNRLQQYLEHFRAHLSVPEYQKREVMEEIEGRISKLFYQEVGDSARVVTLDMANRVTATLGMPDGAPESGASAFAASEPVADKPRRLYRDVDDKRIAGICSGLALYFDIDVTLIRIIMLVALICGSAGFWIYVILWIAVPKAVTSAQKCEMRGISPTAENMSRYSRTQK